MKMLKLTSFFAVFVAAVLTAVVSAQAPTPGLRLEKTEHDWGRVKDEVPVETMIKVFNDSDKEYTLKSITSSCSCTQPEPGPVKVPAKGFGEFKVKYDAALRQGDDLKTVHIETDDPANPKMSVKFKAFVNARVMIEPRALFMGEFNREAKSPPSRVVITNRMADNPLHEIELADPHFDMRKVATEEIMVDGEKATRVTMEIVFKGDKQMLTFKDFMKIKFMDPTKMGQFNVPVIAVVVGDLRIVPDKLFLRLNANGPAWTERILFQSRSKTDFKILGIEVEGEPDLKIQVKEEVDTRMPATYSLVVSGVSPGPREAGVSQLGNCVIKVKTSIPIHPVVEIKVEGNVTTPANLAVKPATPATSNK